MKNFKNNQFSILVFGISIIFFSHSCNCLFELPYDVDYYDQPAEGLLQGTDSDESLEGFNVHAGYGNDVVYGTAEDDILDGGYGEDSIFGGAGNDLLISKSDGREARVGRSFNKYRDPQNLINYATKTLNTDFPIKANDVLSGGKGADVFRFITLINAKGKFLKKNKKSNGNIKWMDITLKNTYIHDHWVERIGNDIITDFSSKEGDKIQIIGHTTTVNHVEHIKRDEDGKQNISILYLKSNQGALGAHHDDHIGTITVYGDLVQNEQISLNNIPAIGIVKNIKNLSEALEPRVYEKEVEEDRVPSLASQFTKMDEVSTCGTINK